MRETTREKQEVGEEREAERVSFFFLFFVLTNERDNARKARGSGRKKEVRKTERTREEKKGECLTV